MHGTNLGRWKGDDLAATVGSNAGSGYYAEFPKVTRFAHSVAKILSIRRARSPGTLNSAPSVYILGAVPEVDLPTTREPIFNAGAAEVCGRVWFGAEGMSSCKSFTLPNSSPDDVFRFVGEVLGAGDKPTIFFDGTADQNVLRLYPEGLNQDHNCQEIKFSGEQLTEESLKELLDELHKRMLITPTASGLAARLWEDGAKAFPVRDSERVIQDAIESGLAIAMGSIRVKREHTGVSGRYDLALVEKDPLDSAITKSHALLELKVVKSYTHTGNGVAHNANKKAVTKGVKQAGAYKKEHGFLMSALCCFDMQKKHTLEKCCEHESALAAKLGVRLWVWPLFSTPEAYRDWDAANGSTM